MKTIEQSPNVCLEPKDNRLARDLWRGSGDLLLVERAWLSTYRVLSTITTRRVLSNVWWPMRTKAAHLKDSKLEANDVSKIMALWFNSTYGSLLLFSIAEITRGAWVGFKKEPLSSLPTIDLGKLKGKDAKTLIDLYNEIRLKELKPIPEEYAKPDVKKTIDDAFSQILNIKSKPDALYKLLAHDPTLTAQPLKQG